MKLTKTDHHEQALVLVPRIKCLIREGMEAILKNNRLSVELRDDALRFQRDFIDAEIEDRPVLFQKSQVIQKCPDCAGTGTEKTIPDNKNEDVEYTPCKMCEGAGRLYVEVIRKGYVPTDYHRRKLAK